MIGSMHSDNSVLTLLTNLGCWAKEFRPVAGFLTWAGWIAQPQSRQQQIAVPTRDRKIPFDGGRTFEMYSWGGQQAEGKTAGATQAALCAADQCLCHPGFARW